MGLLRRLRRRTAPAPTTNDLVQAHPTRDRVQRESLLWYWGNVYSQRGQDGILREIFSRVGIDRGTFVEFGGWDGIHLSNCRLLYERGWRGVFIEADEARFAELRRNYARAPGIVCVNELVSSENALDRILAAHAPSRTADFVSIDIDGLDLEVALASRLPEIQTKVLLIEGGFAFDPRLQRHVPSELARRNVGQPLAVMIRELGAIGYEPVCFFQDLYVVRRDLVDRFSSIRRDPVSLYLDAFRFMGDDHRRSVEEFRREIGAGDIEKAESIRFLEGLVDRT
jgi:hypothetical protein